MQALEKKFIIKSQKQKELFDKVQECIKKDYELFSFDIFDTLITRTTLYPSGIFAIMQKELQTNSSYSLIPSFIKENFYSLRFGAEKQLNLRRLKQLDVICNSISNVKKEFSIEDIYNHISYNHNIKKEQIEQLIALEFETELKNILPLEETIEILKYILNQNKKVILISDMYLKEDFIRQMLVNIDSIFKDIPIYLSSEYYIRKSDQGLYRIVQKQENINPKKWLHIGDNEKSDIEVAQKLNIDAFFIQRKELSELEKIFEERPCQNNAAIQLILGSNANTRIALSDNKKADFSTVATSILYPYVHWIIQNSIEKNINRLYFIARDGYILKKIADIIIEENNYDIKTHYIYGSRDAWRMPCSETMDDITVAFTRQKNLKTISIIAKGLDISPQDLIKFLPKHYHDINKKIPENQIYLLYNYLNKDNLFIDYLKEKNKDKKNLLIKYLKQEIDFSDENFAFVDLTVSGVSVNLLSKLIYKEFGKKTKCFAFHYYNNKVYETCDIYGYCLEFIDDYVEFFCRAPHGQTIGYKKENEKIVPILDDSEKQENFDEYTKGIEYCAKLMEKSLKLNNENSSLDILKSYLKTIKETPTKDFAFHFGKIKFADFGTSKAYKQKEKFGIMDVIDFYFLENKKISLKYSMFSIILQNSSFATQLLAKFFQNHPKFKKAYIKKMKHQTIMALKHEFFY